MCHFSSHYLKQGNKNHLYHPKVQFYHTVVYLFSFFKLLWSFKSPLHIGLTLMTHLWTLQISDIHIAMAFMGGSTNRQKDPKAISSTPFSSSPNNVFPSPIPLYDVLANITLRIRTSKLHSSWKHAIVQSEILLSRLFRLFIQHLHSANYTGTAAGKVQTPHLGIQTIRTVSSLLISAHWPSTAISLENSPLDLDCHSSLWGRETENILRRRGIRFSPYLHHLGESPRSPGTMFMCKRKGTEPPPGSCLHENSHPIPIFLGTFPHGYRHGNWVTTLRLTPKPWETQGKAVGMLGKERFKRYRGKSPRITVFKLHPCSQPTLD